MRGNKLAKNFVFEKWLEVCWTDFSVCWNISIFIVKCCHTVFATFWSKVWRFLSCRCWTKLTICFSFIISTIVSFATRTLERIYKLPGKIYDKNYLKLYVSSTKPNYINILAKNKLICSKGTRDRYINQT